MCILPLIHVTYVFILPLTTTGHHLSTQDMTLRMKEKQLFWMDKALQSAFVKMRGLMGRLDSKAKSKRQALFEEILERASAMDTLAYTRFNPDNHRDFDLEAVVTQVTEPVKYIDRAGKERLEREREERGADKAEV